MNHLSLTMNGSTEWVLLFIKMMRIV